MAEYIVAPWLDRLDPAEQMAELRERLLDATDQFVAGELEIRAAARKRNRALSVMKDVRHTMVQLATRHGLPVPENRFGRLWMNSMPPSEGDFYVLMLRAEVQALTAMVREPTARTGQQPPGGINPRQPAGQTGRGDLAGVRAPEGTVDQDAALPAGRS